jgi:hypothetical protein
MWRNSAATLGLTELGAGVVRGDTEHDGERGIDPVLMPVGRVIDDEALVAGRRFLRLAEFSDLIDNDRQVWNYGGHSVVEVGVRMHTGKDGERVDSQIAERVVRLHPVYDDATGFIEAGGRFAQGKRHLGRGVVKVNATATERWIVNVRVVRRRIGCHGSEDE